MNANTVDCYAQSISATGEKFKRIWFLSIGKSAYVAFCDIQFICKYRDTCTSDQRFQNLYVILKKRASIAKYNDKQTKKQNLQLDHIPNSSGKATVNKLYIFC